MSVLRIGAGAGFSGDRIEPAVDLAKRGELDFLIFECLAERTIAKAQKARLSDPNAGYDPLLEWRMRAVLPVIAMNGTRIVSNMGAANPRAAARLVRDIARELGLDHLRIAAVTGDDVLDQIGDFTLEETGSPAASLKDRLVSANAYIGVAPVVAALDAGADIVICGRAADPVLFLAPLVHHFRWRLDDWERLGRGTLVGHLLECGAQITGGYFADPGKKDVPNLAEVGFPLAEVTADGNAVITKIDGTGGCVTRATCIEQLLYEIHDPASYFQPDVIADFSGVDFTEVGPDRVAVSGATGRAANGSLKVSVGYRDGWKADGQISYAGVNCVARAELAGEILKHRLSKRATGVTATHCSLIGATSIPRKEAMTGSTPSEVRLRFAARCDTLVGAEAVVNEVESLYLCGPAGGGGVSRSVEEIVAIASTMIPAEKVQTGFELLEVSHAVA
ncbi:acyclic terpene utilization AtuA family protein [Gymnodinialimonas sp. 57CJ19]|uniref:acyclic terpene utilization AtuA family protein n=1 Tax=Gymnodinialimonas sp. 57CJ19 TaxID=3138498 RepID=UPI0031343469